MLYLMAISDKKNENFFAMNITFIRSRQGEFMGKARRDCVDCRVCFLYYVLEKVFEDFHQIDNRRLLKIGVTNKKGGMQ